jgi:hypothetical protein
MDSSAVLGFIPVDVRSQARQVGRDFAWPVAVAPDVINAVAASGRMVLGLELWTFSSGMRTPKVIGSSDYGAREAGSRLDAIRRSSEAARLDLLRVVSDPTLWVQIEWDEPR